MADFESGHWYTHEGKLVTDVAYADKKRAGETHPPTLRDARKFGYLPSVTTIMAILDKPGLRKWKLEWAIECALRAPQMTVEEVVEESSAYVEYAANQGSKIHLGISHRLTTGDILEIEPEVDDTVREFMPWYRDNGFDLRRSEAPIVATGGWAGTIDYIGTYHGEPAIVDFKTQDFESVSKALFYDEHWLQLAGYAVGSDLRDHRRMSVILSRQVPGLVALHDWTEKRGVDQRPWMDAVWLALWEFWKLYHNYYPLENARNDDPDRPNC